MNNFYFGKAKNKVHFICISAILLGLTIALQFISSLLGQQVITGSIVNMMLLLSSLFVGLIGSSLIGLLTPLIGFILGFQANIVMVPFISIANLIYILIFSTVVRLLSNKNSISSALKDIIAIVLCSVFKFCFMYFIELKLIIPLLFSNIPEALKISFGILQLITASIGGLLYLVLKKPLKDVVK